MRRLHLLGIGGSGLSGIATVLAERGVEVSGCDRDTGGHDPSHLDVDMEVGYSGAVPDDEPELVEARRLGLELHHRADLLAEIVAAGEGIAVAGSHGKTTTSGMIAFVLSELGADPTFVVGGSLPQLGVNARSGAGRHVVVEADESDGSLVRLRPRIAVILNVSHDHHDRYATRGELLELLDGWTRSFAPGASVVAPDGIDLGGAAMRRFGLGEGEGWRALHATSDAEGARFVLRRPDAPDLAVALSVPGVHNASNATAALAALELAGVPPELAAPVLGRFTGAGRRFETVGVARGVRFVDDYGHHPNEIEATLRVAREQVGTGRVILCLLPHQPFRVRHLRRELAAASMHADLTCVLDVWVARGNPEEGIDGKLVVDEILRLDPAYPVAWTPGFDDAALWLSLRTRPGDLVVGMGCGPVYEVGRRLLGAARVTQAPTGLEQAFSLARLTTIGTGGEASWFARPTSRQALQDALRFAADDGLEVAVVGLGSNLLVSDAGFDGLVVRLDGELASIELTGERATCGGGAALAALVRRATDAALSGIEFGCAIPGTVGGAVRMNAGAYGGELRDVLVEAMIVSATGVRHGTPAGLALSYRHSNVARGEVVASATLQLAAGDAAVIRETVRAMQARRSAAQPRKARTFGSVFKNPDEGPGAGQLLEACELKGFAIGGARISEVHANFIENAGAASSADVAALIGEARRRARERFGVELEHEVQLLGPIVIP